MGSFLSGKTLRQQEQSRKSNQLQKCPNLLLVWVANLQQGILGNKDQ